MPLYRPQGLQQPTDNPLLQKILGGVLGPQQTYGGILTPEDQRAAQQQGLLALGSQLLSAGGPSPTPVSFGQALGSALQAGQQTQRQSGLDALQAMLLRTKLQATGKKKYHNVTPGGAIVDPETGKVVFQNDAGAAAGKIGNFNPGDYTPDSLARYLETIDPKTGIGNTSLLVRYVTPASPTVVNIGQVPNVVTPQRDGGAPVIQPLSTSQVEADAARKRKEAEAAGSAAGEASGAQAAKAPAAASMEYVLKQFEDQFDQTLQGGPLGVVGKAGTLFDYGDAVRFDNLREQLSTEIRTVYRIPGEGTLSDREQAQYGIQLPNRNFPPSVNKAIVADLRERTRLRLETPTAPSEQGQQPKRVRVDAQGNVIGN